MPPVASFAGSTDGMLLREERLEGVHPDLQAVVRKAAANLDHDIMVLEGLRTKERQAELFKKGATTTMNSKHLVGKAVDLAPMLDDGQVSWHWPHYYELAPVMKAAASDLGIRVEWGGDWKHFKDGPHWQLPT